MATCTPRKLKGSTADEEIQRKQPMKSNLNRFFGETSLHGVRYLADADVPVFRKVVWAICILAAFAYFLMVFTLSVQDYLMYHSVISEKVHVAKDGIAFPAITFCTVNKIKNSTIYELFPELTPYMAISRRDYMTSNFSRGHLYVQQMRAYGLWELFLQTAPAISDTFVQCRVQRVIVNCADYLTLTLWREGNCYTFNGYTGNNDDIILRSPGYTKSVEFILRDDESDYFYPTGKPTLQRALSCFYHNDN